MTKYDHVWKSSSAVFDTLVEVPWANPLNPDLKNAYSPFCSPYISYGTSKENYLNVKTSHPW